VQNLTASIFLDNIPAANDPVENFTRPALTHRKKQLGKPGIEVLNRSSCERVTDNDSRNDIINLTPYHTEQPGTKIVISFKNQLL
jgi:hypothetical protein